jgi:MoaA/NifB/PqqE/SkfB family radical SAM enzyme
VAVAFHDRLDCSRVGFFKLCRHHEQFALSWPQRERLLHIMREAGVLWLQLTDGEPLIGKLFPGVYELAYELGMMISISSNGSRLSNRKILHLLTARRPYRLTLSVYGATTESYDGLTRRRGSFAAFTKGLAAAYEARASDQPQPDRRTAQRSRDRSDDRPGREL